MKGDFQAYLDGIGEAARADLEKRNAARDRALAYSRELIRWCATAIRAAHREDAATAAADLAQANAVAASLRETLHEHPDLYYEGYTQDALKELVEAHVTLALLADQLPPRPEVLSVPYDTFLNGLCEAASELRRRVLDVLRAGRYAEAERLLGAMDAVYDVLITFDYPDAITGGLRRRVDQFRAVLERTRGDLTNSLQAQRLLEALAHVEKSSAE